MDAWNPDQLKRMQAGGNGKLNTFFQQYGVPKHTDIKEKYNSKPAEFYREKIRAEVDGRSYTPPLPSEVRAPLPRPKSFAGTASAGFGSTAWDQDSWDEPAAASNSRGHTGGRPAPHAASESRLGATSGEYTMAQLHASAASKEEFFSRTMAQNATKPEGIPPSQGGKYVGFGSTPALQPSMSRRPGSGLGGGAAGVDDVAEMLQRGFHGLGTLAGQAAGVAKEQALHVNHALKEAGVQEQLSQTAAVAAEKTKEYGSKGWSLLKNVYTVAASKLEETAAQQGIKVDLGARKLADSTRYGAVSGGGSGSYSRVGGAAPVGYGAVESDEDGGGWNNGASGGGIGGMGGGSTRGGGPRSGQQKSNGTHGGGFGMNSSEAGQNEWGDSAWESAAPSRNANSGGGGGGLSQPHQQRQRQQQQGGRGEWKGWEDADADVDAPSPGGGDEWGKW
jgi:ADP-ribosylation factor GTPase-activating protein 1